MNTNSSNTEFYEDESDEIVATVILEGRSIKIRTSAEFEAFVNSVMTLPPEEMFRQAIWLLQMTHSLATGVKSDMGPMNIMGRRIVPLSTPEANIFLDSLFDQQFDSLYRQAIATVLSKIAKQLFEIATDREPSLLPNYGVE